MIEKTDVCENNPEKSSATKVSEHTLSDFSISTISLFKDIEDKHDLYWGKDYMKIFCESIKKHTVKIINFKKKKNDIINQDTAVRIRKKKILKISLELERVRDHCYCTIIFLVPREREVAKIDKNTE